MAWITYSQRMWCACSLLLLLLFIFKNDLLVWILTDKFILYYFTRRLITEMKKKTKSSCIRKRSPVGRIVATGCHMFRHQTWNCVDNGSNIRLQVLKCSESCDVGLVFNVTTQLKIQGLRSSDLWGHNPAR